VTAANCERLVESVVASITCYLDGDFTRIVNPEALAARQSLR